MPKAYLPDDLFSVLSVEEVTMLQQMTNFIKVTFETCRKFTDALQDNQKVADAISTSAFSWSQDYNLNLLDRAKTRFSSIGLEGTFEGISGFLNQQNPMPDIAGIQQLLVEKLEAAKPEILSKAPESLAWGVLGTKMMDSLFVYGATVDVMLDAAKSGNDKWLVKLVSIDRAALEIPEISARIRRAETIRSEQDEAFLADLRKAMKGPSGYIGLTHPYLRPLLFMTYGTGALEKLGYQDRHELFVNRLGVYPSDGADPAEGLNKFIDRWKESVADLNLKFAS